MIYQLIYQKKQVLGNDVILLFVAVTLYPRY